MSEPANGEIASDTKSDAKKIIEKTNERPEWLPDGWNVDFRIRKSGAHMGSGYKCYIDPLNKYKFYSKPEVLRYLETIKDNSCISKMEKKHVNSPSNVVVEKSNVEDLPHGWVKEVKVTKNSRGIRKDPFYTDPVSGYVFRSKKDVLRYLESGDISACAFKPRRRQIEDEDQFIPSPAAKRQKLKQSATKQWRSVGKEVSDKSSLELSDANISEKGQDVKVPSGMMVASVHTGESVVKMLSLEGGAANPPEMKRTSDPDDVKVEDRVVNVMENANEKNHIEHTISKAKEELKVHRRFSPRLAGIEPVLLANNMTSEQTLQVPKRNMRKSRATLNADGENKPSQHFCSVPEIEHGRKMQQKVIDKSNNVSDGRANFSEQPCQVETEKIEDNKPEQNQYSLSGDSGFPGLNGALRTIRAELPSLDNSYNGHDLASEAHVLKENKLHESKMGKGGTQEIPTNSNKSSNKKQRGIPCRASKRLAGLDHELMSNSISCEKPPKYSIKNSEDDANAESQLSDGGPAMEVADHAPNNEQLENRKRKPAITSNRVEKFEVEEMNNERAEPQLSFVFNYSRSDPSLEFATNTLTSALPVGDSVDNEPTKVPVTDIQNINLFDNDAGRSRDKNPQVHSNKSKNRKELKMPRRLSKRLAGLEPEVLPSERALEYIPRKSFKDEPIVIATATAILSNGASEHDAGKETELNTMHATDSLKTRVEGESSNKSEMSCDAQIDPREQLQKLEAEDIGDERSEPQLPLPFGESWSDPCLEFAIKTLTGDLPVDATADILSVVTPDANDPPNKELHETVVEKSMNQEVHDNSRQSQIKKELSSVCQPSVHLPGQPELRMSSTSCENCTIFASREPCRDEGHVTRNLDGQPPHVEAGNITQLVHHSRNKSAAMHEEPLKVSEQILEGESVTTEHPQLATETINHDNTDQQFCASFMDSWSDPCLEFAFKTLTGAIPVEENLETLGCFQDPVNCHDLRDGCSTLPEFGSSSFAQSDFSFNFDIGEKSMPVQQSSMSSSFLPLDKPSLHGCTGVDPQIHHSQSNKNFHGR